MEQLVIAVDVDGTLYDGSGVATEATDALTSARDAGHRIVIVTGRRWEQLGHVVPTILPLCERAVCEEGTVLVDVSTGHFTLLGPPADVSLVEALSAEGVAPLDVGHVVIGAPSSARAKVDLVLAHIGSKLVITTNKGSIGMMPAGCDKGAGLTAAIMDLGVPHLRVLAIGDAANDLPMFAVASLPVAVANADDAVRASGVPMTMAASGLGVAEALRSYLPRSATVPCS